MYLGIEILSLIITVIWDLLMATKTNPTVHKRNMAILFRCLVVV